jgi:hypothetical protein
MNEKLPDEILSLIHSKVVSRPSDKDSNFNYVHQEDVFDIARAAYQKGKAWHLKGISIAESICLNCRKEYPKCKIRRRCTVIECDDFSPYNDMPESEIKKLKQLLKKRKTASTTHD